jgi:hypothetical protein
MSILLKDWLAHIAKVGIFPEITVQNLAQFELVAAKFWDSYNTRFMETTKRMRDSK